LLTLTPPLAPTVTPASTVTSIAATPVPTPAAFGLTAATLAVTTQESWPEVALFRLREDPVTRKPSVELLTMAATRDGKSIQLSEPVDAAVFGSPIVTPDGVIGLVQDEQTGAFLPDDLLAPAALPAPVPAPGPAPAPDSGVAR
jgi:hypothetical protein